tara:strand:+ start:126 stop:266 length:141 start_codon:yes stop_codon:yes gene_type:complete
MEIMEKKEKLAPPDQLDLLVLEHQGHPVLLERWVLPEKRGNLEQLV